MKGLLLILFLSLGLIGQGQSDRWIEARGGHGFFIPHRNTLPQLLTGHTNFLELGYSARVDGSKAWHHGYKGPLKGISLFYMDMGNERELGDLIALYPHVTLPLAGTVDAGLMLRMGIGFAYVTKIYDRRENMFNTAIGSHVNYNILMSLTYRKSVGRWVSSAGISMTHASNAALQLPNLGVNMATADFTLGFRLNREHRPLLETEFPDVLPSSQFSLTLALAMRQSDSFLDNLHGVQEVRAKWEKPLSDKLSYSLGADVIHNRATYIDIPPDSLSGPYFLQVGVNAGLLLRFGTNALFFENGVYLSQGEQDLGGIYHRVGGRKRLNDRCHIDLTLKTHFACSQSSSPGFSIMETLGPPQ